MVSRLLTPHAPLCPVVLCQPTQRVGLVEARQNKNSCSVVASSWYRRFVCAHWPLEMARKTLLVHRCTPVERLRCSAESESARG